MESTCLFHTDRCHFDIVNRDIEKTKILPRKQAKRLAMCVCSCTKCKIDVTQKVKQLELQEMAEFLNQSVRTENWPVSVVAMLKPMLYNIRVQQYSHAMFVLILYNAIKHQNYDLMESFITCKRIESKTDCQRMTPTQFQFMMNKKWKKSQHSLDVTIPMFAGNTKLLQNNEQMKQISLLHKDIVLKIDHKANNEFIEKNMKKTKIKLSGKSEKCLLEVVCQLRKIGAEIQNKLDKKYAVDHERRKEAKKMRRYYWNNYGIDDIVTKDSLDYKDEMTDFYNRRCNSHKIGCKIKSGSDPLKDGHCMNCLAKFVTLKNPDECKFHPGYIGCDKNWSCCGLKAESFHPTLEEHIKTGCFTSVHNWRHGKDEKKMKKQMKSKTYQNIRQKSRKFDQNP